jgi:hypothetical protein
MSSHNVSPAQPPLAAMHDLRQMPAEPLKIIGSPERLRAVCSTMKCPSTPIASPRANGDELGR